MAYETKKLQTPIDTHGEHIDISIITDIDSIEVKGSTRTLAEILEERSIGTHVSYDNVKPNYECLCLNIDRIEKDIDTI